MIQEFLGFRRPDGSVGVRNDLLILSTTGLTGPVARRIGKALPEAKVITTPYGSGVVGDDGALRDRMLLGFACHPNVGAVLLLSGKQPEAEEYRDQIAATGRPVELLLLDLNNQDSLRLTDTGIRAGARLLRQLSRESRSPAPISELFLAAECGRSDPSSGLAANPLVGHVADRVVALGGRFVAGETMEWFGAEHFLNRRAASPEIAEAIRNALARRMDHAKSAGIDLIGNNPGPTNIAGGLTTLEEKSLGAIHKSGSSPIVGVLAHGQRPSGPGCWLMDQPFYAPESLSGLSAAGAQIVLFTTGPGNSYCSLLAPTIKISANVETCANLPEQIDFDASGILLGMVSKEEATDRLITHILETASGASTFGEILLEGEEVVTRIGASL
ncbi:UxaA family hydrolase [Oricola indica]|jgi:altronate dehydratase large subunit|uniref:UxaA family hydrolase n=1 Tax=Oricola indica TaxID=2872591 RepID=UPI001CBF583C|nr:UxaA family hydrolase [Oricola indica]